MLALLLFWVLQLYLIILLARVLLSWVPMINPTWVPKGIVLVLVEGIYAVTDPPIKGLRRVIKPVQMGGISLDLAVLVLFVLVQLAIFALRFLPI